MKKLGVENTVPLHTIVLSDEVTLWWQKNPRPNGAGSYCVSCNGVKAGETEKTHFTVKGLRPESAYSLRVEGIGEVCVTTGKEKRRIDVTGSAYRAIGDGKTLNTSAIQKAIDDCGADECVYFPPGVYLTGALNLHGDMEIFLDRGAILQGTANVEDYLPKIKSRFEGIERECYRSLLNLGELDHTAGYNCRNVVFRGGGVISGGGKELCRATIEQERSDMQKQDEETVKACGSADTLPGRARGRLINVSNCENIVFADLTFENGPAWNLHFIYSANIITYGCKIVSHDIFNGDGWDPDSSENCVIFDTVFDTSDDCIAIKSGKNPEGNRINRPCKNIYVFDCTAENGHGVSIGSEISGGVENVSIWDCDLQRTWHGLQVKGTKKRGGYVKNVSVRNCVVPCLLIWSVGYNDDGESAAHPPVFSDYLFENVTVTGNEFEGKKRYICLRGFDVEGYEISNVTLQHVTPVGADVSRALQTEFTKNVFLLE